MCLPRSIGVLCFFAATLASAAPEASRPTRGFSVPHRDPVFQFPGDHGSHPDFKLEWWYVTGHLYSEAGRRFGFQATFFRNATAPADAAEPPGGNTMHLAHMAWLDPASGRFIHQERLNRDGWDAGAATNRLDVWNGNWSLRSEADPIPCLRLLGSVRADVEFDLLMRPLKPLTFFGEGGYARKAAESNAASYYLSWPRLQATGHVTVDGRHLIVTGQAWMDHEISSGQLGKGQVGWDWVCIQLHDGRDLMAYRMRRSDGSTDPSSTCTWIDRRGVTRPLSFRQFRWRPIRHWISPVTGARYPNRVQLKIDGPGAEAGDFRIEPLAEDQELYDGAAGIAYWEGACEVRDPAGVVVGEAYLELVGYAGSLGARLR